MRAAPAQHVDIHLVGLGHHEIHLHGRDGGEALQEADAQRAVRHDLGERQRGRVAVEAALGDLEIGGDGAEVVVGRLVGEVSET